MPNESVSLKIFGRVQNVSYRYYAEEEARRLGLKGCIKNLHDGTVEVYVEGDIAKLKNFISWCWNGSPAAEVRDIKEKWGPAKNEYADFGVTYH